MHPKTNQHLDFKAKMTNRRDYKNKISECKRMGKTEGKKNLNDTSSSKTSEQMKR